MKLDQTESTVSLQLLADGLSAVQRGTDRTAAELAIRRLTEAMTELEQKKVELSSVRRTTMARWNPQTAATGIAMMDVMIAAFSAGIVGLVVAGFTQSMLHLTPSLATWFVVAVSAAVLASKVFRLDRTLPVRSNTD